MFPYPSGSGLHVGHPRGYTATDVYARYKKLNGYNVLHPMGWDAFGLPAENYAIKNKVHPSKVVEENVANFKEQLKKFDLSYDWDHEVNTTDPKYYRWTQFIFLKLFERGLAYEAEVPINFCPSCKTGLANEEVIGGKCERCGTEIERRSLRQWILKITEYADRLLSDLDELDWPEPIKEMQRNWIGRSEGSNIIFPIKNKLRYVLLHGYTGSPETNFFPWLKSELEKTGSEVIVPKLPNSDDPKVYNQVEAVLSSVDFDENTVVVGHSLGSIVALKILEKLEKPIHKTVLVASFGENNFLDENFPEYAFDWKFDSLKINQNGGEIIILRDTTDDVVPQENTAKIQAITGAKLIDYAAKRPHYTGKEEPTILANCQDSIEVYTTRADTLFGCTWVVMAPEHKLVEQLKDKIENYDEVKEYIIKSQNKSDLERTELQKEKTGVELKGITAVNPINGKEIPVWIADYVLAHYGTGAVMAVPAHDERDYEFAKKYGIDIIPTIVKSSDNYKSYLMGADDISDDDLKKLQITITKKPESKVRMIEIPKSSIDEYEKLIESKLTNGFWNEYVGERITFIFKHKDGKVEKLEYKSINEDRINKLTAEFTNDTSGKTIIEDWLDTGADGYYQDYLLSTEYGRLIQSKEFDGLDSETAKRKITEKLKETGHGDFKVNYKLRDWVFSRQRYWGEPIPIIHCDKCGIVPVPEKDLPVVLPHVENYEPTGDGTSPLANESDPIIKDWLYTKCPKCGGEGKRETNTMPQWAGSCWYYIGYLIKNGDNYDWDIDKIDPWLPVDLYVGGAEHAVLHLLYARFWHKVLFDEKLVSSKEPFQRLVSVGTILGIDGQKMSKSRGNVINPDPLLDKYGSDALKMYELYIGPFSQSAKWSQNGIVGMHRFLQKVEKLEIADQVSNNDVILNKAIKKVGEDIESFNFNTAISTLIETFDSISKNGWNTENLSTFLTLLSPFAPQTAAKVASDKNVEISNWPAYDPDKIIDQKITLAVQVNGKVRDEVEINVDADEKEVEQIALQSDKIKSWIPESGVKKFIYIKGKIINIVV